MKLPCNLKRLIRSKNEQVIPAISFDSAPIMAPFHPHARLFDVGGDSHGLSGTTPTRAHCARSPIDAMKCKPFVVLTVRLLHETSCLKSRNASCFHQCSAFTTTSSKKLFKEAIYTLGGTACTLFNPTGTASFPQAKGRQKRPDRVGFHRS